MSENKCCIECGNVIPSGVTECPNCGCPIEEPEIEKNEIEKKISVAENEKPQLCNDSKNKSKKSWLLVNSMPIVSIIIGILMIIIGCLVMNRKADSSMIYEGNNYNAKSYSVEDYSFGADFYTEIYEASNTIVDELNDINRNVADGITDMNHAASAITGSMNNMIDTIYFVSGMLIIILGMGTVAIACLHMKKEKFKEEEKFYGFN